jgi:hypothetical protein
MENSNFIFRKIDVINQDKISYKELHNLLFKGASISNEWINWYHKDIGSIENWSIGTRTWGVFDCEKLIGIWSVEPKTMIYNSKIIKVGRCFAVGIHPDYRRLGLFVTLSQFAINEEKKIREFEYILGFPQQGRTVIGGHLKAGWEECMNIDIYSRSNQVQAKYVTKNQFNFISNFTSCSEGFLENSNYLNQRWIYHPDHQYLNYSYNTAFVVLKPYANFCHILKISGDIDDVKFLFHLISVLSKKHGWQEVNIWCSDLCQYKNLLLELGFIKGAEFGLPIQLIAVKINATKSLNIEKVNFQMGVEEGY